MKDDATHNPQELIAAIRSGDAEAFGNFYRGYVDSLVMFLAKIIRNEEDAKEVTQILSPFCGRTAKNSIHTHR